MNQKFHYSGILLRSKTTDAMPAASEDSARRADIGANLRRLRKSAGLTLNDLAERSTMSRSALSKIERGDASPSYGTMLKIAAGLDVPLEILLGVEERAAVARYAVTRAGAGVLQETGRFRHRLLSPSFSGRGLYAFHSEVLATSPDQYEAFDVHGSEDLIFVLDGRLSVHLPGPARVELGPGDAIQMDGNLEHALTISDPTNQKHPTRILWVTVQDGRPSDPRAVSKGGEP